MSFQGAAISAAQAALSMTGVKSIKETAELAKSQKARSDYLEYMAEAKKESQQRNANINTAKNVYGSLMAQGKTEEATKAIGQAYGKYTENLGRFKEFKEQAGKLYEALTPEYKERYASTHGEMLRKWAPREQQTYEQFVQNSQFTTKIAKMQQRQAEQANRKLGKDTLMEVLYGKERS